MYAGEKNPAYGAEMVTLTCASCGDSFERRASIHRVYNRKDSFCSRQCSFRYLGQRDKFGKDNPNYGKGEKVTGEKNPNWQGGKTQNSRLFRRSTLYAKWRNNVFKRDRWACVFCGSKKQLEADHIVPVCADFSLALVVDNGRTLCKPCHLQTDTYGGRAVKYKKQAVNK
jgi:5-methylcytosine-specific restriction endonuclease McrA